MTEPREQEGQKKKRDKKISILDQGELAKSAMPQKMGINCAENNNIVFLYKKILLLPGKSNPISCILYDSNQEVLKVYINIYKQATIKEL